MKDKKYDLQPGNRAGFYLLDSSRRPLKWTGTIRTRVEQGKGYGLLQYIIEPDGNPEARARVKASKVWVIHS